MRQLPQHSSSSQTSSSLENVRGCVQDSLGHMSTMRRGGMRWMEVRDIPDFTDASQRPDAISFRVLNITTPFSRLFPCRKSAAPRCNSSISCHRLVRVHSIFNSRCSFFFFLRNLATEVDHLSPQGGAAEELSEPAVLHRRLSSAIAAPSASKSLLSS